MKSAAIPARNLDLLRALAVGCVFLAHISARVNGDSDALDRLGRIGVLLFFVHTALVLMASLERHRESAGSFFVRRIFRIYPLAIVTVIGMALRPPVSVMARHSTAVVELSGWTLFANLTLTQNLLHADYLLGVLWTLPIEIQMYSVLPACFAVARRGTSAVVGLLSVAVAAGVAMRIIGRPEWGEVFTYGPCFVSGILAYALLRKGSTPRLPAWTWPILLVCGIAVFTATPWFTIAKPEHGWPICVSIALLIPLVREMPKGWLTRVAYSVAKYSYGIYLLHLVGFAIAFNLFDHSGPVVQWGLVVVLSAALPVLAYHLLEAPGIELGRRLVNGRRLAKGIMSTSTAPP